MKWFILFTFSLEAMAWTIVGENMGGWATHKLKIYFDSTDCTLPESTLTSFIDDAVKLWNGTPTGSISLERISLKSKVSVTDFLAQQTDQVPIILCDSLIERHNGVNANVVPATTRVAGTKGHLTYAGILLNAQSGSGAEISQLQNSELSVTIAHELGHVLGLGHSGSKDALMYYSIADKSRAVLTEDDTDGLSFLYPKNELTLAPFGCAAVHRDVHRSDSASRGVVIGFLVFLFINLYLGRKIKSVRPL